MDKSDLRRKPSARNRISIIWGRLEILERNLKGKTLEDLSADGRILKCITR
jgi:hypothetical protein